MTALPGIPTDVRLTLAAIVAAAVVSHAVLRALVLRRGRRRSPGADAALHGALAPLAALIWIVALSVTAGLLLAELGGSAAAMRTARAVDWAGRLAAIGALAWLMSRLGRAIEASLAPDPAQTTAGWDDVLLPMAGKAARILLPLAAVMLGVPLLPVPQDYETIVRNGLSLVLIGAVSLILYQLVEAAAALVLRRYRLDVADNLEARSVYTQVTVLRKVASAVIGIFTLASMLMVFESVRQLGTSILASAGIAGIIVGFAAQRSIATLLAGLQIAATQPIRLDDVVIVENEWGRIEDITLTYVMVRIWDERRLIVPITYFIERPFQNWTRTSSAIIGAIVLHVDYRAPLAEMRTELDRILAASPYWDGRVKALQVTEATAHTLEVRALASAADASLAWDLRCEVRERLIAFLQQHHPDSLPRIRAEVQGAGALPVEPPAPATGLAGERSVL